MKKALILYGSPRLNGDIASMVELFKSHFKGETETVFLYQHLSQNAIGPCTDCRGCCYKKGCIINDDFSKLIQDDYDILVIASPIYMSNVTPPIWNVISRFNFDFNNKQHLGIKTEFKPKQGVLLLAGGGGACKKLMGKTNEENAIKEASYIFSKLNASLDERIALSLNTDSVPASEDEDVKAKIKDIAISL